MQILCYLLKQRTQLAEQQGACVLWRKTWTGIPIWLDQLNVLLRKGKTTLIWIRTMLFFHPRKGTSFPATQGMPTLWLYKVLATPKTKIHINNQQLILSSKMKHFSAHSYETTHTCTGFRLNTWNASALIDKNLRNFLVSIFSSSSACFTCTRGNKYAYKEKIWE